MAKVYCITKDERHDFYLSADGSEYYLFSQNRWKSVDCFYRDGVHLEKAINHGIGRSDWAIHHTMDKLMTYIPYIEKECGIIVLRKTIKKQRKAA